MIHAHQNGVWLMKPWVTALAYSGGKQSHVILEMVLRGDLERPKNFIVLNANPGMENSISYQFVNEMEARCKDAGIPFLRCERNLYKELIELKESGKTRFDTPPLWTKNRETGKRGRLMQKCTGAYKIAPMDRALRRWMHDNIGIPIKATNLGRNSCRRWIGFSNDEWIRIKESKKEYEYCEYPLIDKKMGEKEITAYYIKNNIKIPPRSVCNACFANDVAYLKDMHKNRPSDWQQAVNVDEAIRDLTQIGVRDECYVSSTLIPLKKLAEMNFIIPKGLEEIDSRCHSGYCFT